MKFIWYINKQKIFIFWLFEIFDFFSFLLYDSIQKCNRCVNIKFRGVIDNLFPTGTKLFSCFLHLKQIVLIVYIIPSRGFVAPIRQKIFYSIRFIGPLLQKLETKFNNLFPVGSLNNLFPTGNKLWKGGGGVMRTF